MSLIWLDFANGRANWQRLTRNRWLRHRWFIYQKMSLTLVPLIGEELPQKPIYRKAHNVRKRTGHTT